MKKWFHEYFMTEHDLVSFVNKYNLKPGEILILKYSTHSETYIGFMYYAEHKLNKY